MQYSSTKRLPMMMSKTTSKNLQRTIKKVIGKKMAIEMVATVERKEKRWTALYPTSFVSSRTRIFSSCWAKTTLKQCTELSMTRRSVDSFSSFSKTEGSSALVYVFRVKGSSVAISLP